MALAGVVMMVEGTVGGLALIAYFFFQAAKEGIEKQRLLDLAWERGVELDPARAQRAVAAGQSERLERQLFGGGGEPGAPGAPSWRTTSASSGAPSARATSQATTTPPRASPITTGWWSRSRCSGVARRYPAS